MRPLLPASLVAAAAVSALLPHPATADTYAAPADQDGVLEIRDESTGRVVQDGVPEVCAFSLQARDLDRSQRVSWRVAQRPADGQGGGDGTIAETGTLSVNEHGNGHSPALSLAEGTYTLSWRLYGGQRPRGNTDFTISCDDSGPQDGASAPAHSVDPPPGSTPGAVPEASTAQLGGAAGTDTASPTHSRSAAPDTTGPEATAAHDGATPGDAAPARSPRTPAGEDLAHSGTDVSAGALATGAALLLGAGTYLLLRRRGSRG